MAISRKHFEKGDFKNKINKIDNHPILIFLKENQDKAFTIKEIIKHAKTNENTCRGMLRKMKNRKLVDHKSPYFIYGKSKK